MVQKKKLTIQETFTLAYKYHNKNNFRDSEKLYKEIIKKQPEHLEANFCLGLIFLRIRDLSNLSKAKKLFEKVIKINPNYSAAHSNLGQIYQEFGENKKAINCFETAIEIQPNLAAAHNNLGNILLEIGKNKEAAVCFEKVIKINPNLALAYNNLGTVYGSMNDHTKSINCFKKAIQINQNNSMSHYNLGKAYKDSKKYQESIKSFEAANTTRSRAEMLESTYFFLGLEKYKTLLNKLTQSDPLNLRVATMSAYVSKKEKIGNIYPFCKKPLDFIFIKNIKSEIKSPEKFLDKLSNVISKVEVIWQPTNKSTKNGYHTSGNLFNKNDEIIKELQELIIKQIRFYKNYYKSSEDFFIKKWPNNSSIEAWHVRLKKEGYQKSHIHPAGWLSGCFYLKIPKMLKDNQGAIKFTFTGYDYPEDKTLPEFIHVPKTFDIALFPSSLFHQTVPFASQEERHVIAFDLVPKNNNNIY